MTGIDGSAQIELLLQLQPAHARHADVENEASRLRGLVGGQKFLRGSEQSAIEANRLEQDTHGVAHPRVVVDDHHSGSLVLHELSSSMAGRLTWKLAPWGVTGRVPIVPPCPRAMVRLMASPRPVPDFFVVANG